MQKRRFTGGVSLTLLSGEAAILPDDEAGSPPVDVETNITSTESKSVVRCLHQSTVVCLSQDQKPIRSHSLWIPAVCSGGRF